MASELVTRSPSFVDGKSQNAQEMRLHVLSSGGGATPLASRGGVRPSGGSPGLVAALPTPVMKVRVNAGIADIPSTSSTGGFYRVSWDQVDLDIDPSSAQDRTDLIIVEVVDTGTSAATGKVRILKGTSGAGRPSNGVANAHWMSLAATAVRVGAESSGNIRSQDVTPEVSFAVAPGGVLPLKSDAERLALQSVGAVYDGLVVVEQDTDRLWLYTGGGWRYIGGGPPPTYVADPFSGWTAVTSRNPNAYVDGSGRGYLQGAVTNDNTFTPNGTQIMLTLPTQVPSTISAANFQVMVVNPGTGAVSDVNCVLTAAGGLRTEGPPVSIPAGSIWYLDRIDWHPTKPAAGQLP